MKNIKLFFILFLFNPSFSLLCINSIFDRIFPASLRSFKVEPTKEICFKYKLTSLKNKISLTFFLAKSYTAEVVIYKSLYQLEIKNGNYINYEEKYLIIENIFKEIDVSDYYDYVYIIIRDKKNYFFNDHIILYDSELPITLQENKPIEISNFMSNNKYTFKYTSNKNIQFIYSTNIKSHKYITVEYDNNLVINKKVDDNDTLLYLNNDNDNNNNEEKILKIIIENIDDTFPIPYNQEFSLVVYEKSIDEFINIKEDNTIKVNYIKNENVQNFYFYADISSFKQASTLNIKLDYLSKVFNYTNITSDIVYSNDSLEKKIFIDLLPQENKLEYSYERYSDEYLKIFFKLNPQMSNYYKYIIIKIEIKDYSSYYSPKYFTISLSKEMEIINLVNIDYYKAEKISKTSKPYIPLYFKLLLDKDSKYIFTAPYQGRLVLIKGDLLENENENENSMIKINENYLDDEKDIIVLSNLSELTVQIFGSSLKNGVFYVEKINSDDVFIIEDERYNNEISFNMTLNQKKYILGTYNKDIYADGGKKTTKYWTVSENGEFDLYYKNKISIEEQSLFPSLEKNIKEKETAFVLNNHIDFFTIICKKPGMFFLKPIMKIFGEKTHIIGQNSISTVTLDTKTEILQLSSPIKVPSNYSNYLYLSILPINGNNITLIPDTPGVFDEITINENELFTKIIDINKYKSDQLAIKMLSNDLVDLEIIEVIHYNFSEYTQINNNKKNDISKNNVIKFISKETKKLKIKIKGLNEVPIAYGIVKLSSDDINYIPLAYNFKNYIIKKNCTKNEYIEIDNKYFGKEDEHKKYQAFIFSIQSSKIDFKYSVQIEEIKDRKGRMSWWAILLIVIFSILIFFALLIIVLIIKKKRGINIENIKDNQPLYPNRKYILNDIINDSE